MGPSDRAFNQVKAILGKLDRNIDQLREQRTTPAVATPAGSNTTVIPPAPARNPEPTPPRASNSPYGRATPLPPR